MRIKRKDNITAKEVTKNLDAKLLDLQKKSVSLSGTATGKSQSTYIKPLIGTLTSSKIDIESIVNDFSTNMQPTIQPEHANKEKS